MALFQNLSKTHLQSAVFRHESDSLHLSQDQVQDVHHLLHIESLISALTSEPLQVTAALCFTRSFLNLSGILYSINHMNANHMKMLYAKIAAYFNCSGLCLRVRIRSPKLRGYLPILTARTTFE